MIRAFSTRIASAAMAAFSLAMLSAAARAEEAMFEPCSDVMCKIFEVSIRNGRVAAGDATRGPYIVNGENGIELRAGGFIATNSVTCVKSASMPRPIYQAIVDVLQTLGGTERGTDGMPVAYTPSQQTMLLFYTTLMQQTLEFNCMEPASILPAPIQ